MYIATICTSLSQHFFLVLPFIQEPFQNGFYSYMEKIKHCSYWTRGWSDRAMVVGNFQHWGVLQIR